MATLAAGSKVRLAYSLETSDESLGGTIARGTIPGAGSPALKLFPSSSRNVNPERDTLSPNIISPTNRKRLSRHGVERIAGSIGTDISRANVDEFLGWGFGANWVANTASNSGTYSAVNSTSKFTGTGIHTDLVAGDVVRVSGFSAAVDGLYLVTVVGSNEITVAPAPPADVTGDADEAVAKEGSTLKVGTSLYTMFMERQWTDVSYYEQLRGVAPVQLDFDFSPSTVATVSASVVGLISGSDSSSLDASPTASADNPAMQALDGTMVLNGAGIATVTGLTFSLNRQTVAGQGVIGSRYAPDVFDGEVMGTGRITAYIDGATLFDLWAAETEFAIAAMVVEDEALTGYHTVYMPSCKLMTRPADPGQSGPVLATFDFEFGDSSNFGNMIAYQRSN